MRRSIMRSGCEPHGRYIPDCAPDSTREVSVRLSMMADLLPWSHIFQFIFPSETEYEYSTLRHDLQASRVGSAGTRHNR